MRIEPYGVGSVLHVVKRGARGMEIVRNEADRWRFVRMLYLLNDKYQDPGRQTRHRTGIASLTRNLDSTEFFGRPEHWPERKPLVSILAWALMPNHFHILLQTRSESGAPKFMQRLGSSMSVAFNEKYGEKGSLFQGSYKSRTIDTDEYLQYVHAYIVVKNTLELYPGGLAVALRDFDDAWKFAASHPFSSFRSSSEGASSPIIDMSALTSLGLHRTDFKAYARSMLEVHKGTKQAAHDSDRDFLLLEPW